MRPTVSGLVGRIPLTVRGLVLRVKRPLTVRGLVLRVIYRNEGIVIYKRFPKAMTRYA